MSFVYGSFQRVWLAFCTTSVWAHGAVRFDRYATRYVGFWQPGERQVDALVCVHHRHAYGNVFCVIPLTSVNALACCAQAKTLQVSADTPTTDDNNPYGPKAPALFLRAFCERTGRQLHLDDLLLSVSDATQCPCAAGCAAAFNSELSSSPSHSAGAAAPSHAADDSRDAHSAAAAPPTAPCSVACATACSSAVPGPCHVAANCALHDAQFQPPTTAQCATVAPPSPATSATARSYAAVARCGLAVSPPGPTAGAAPMHIDTATPAPAASPEAARATKLVSSSPLSPAVPSPPILATAAPSRRQKKALRQSQPAPVVSAVAAAATPTTTPPVASAPGPVCTCSVQVRGVIVGVRRKLLRPCCVHAEQTLLRPP